MIERTAIRDAYSWGVMHYTKGRLEQRRAAGERLRHRVIGYVRIDDDVDAELLGAVFEELVVMGVLRAPKALRQRMGDRVRHGVSLRRAG